MPLIDSKGEKPLLWGDIVHVAPVQFDDPSITIGYDADPAEARALANFRTGFAGRLCSIGARASRLYPGLGHVRRDGDKDYRFVPLNYSSWLG